MWAVPISLARAATIIVCHCSFATENLTAVRRVTGWSKLTIEAFASRTYPRSAIVKSWESIRLLNFVANASASAKLPIEYAPRSCSNNFRRVLMMDIDIVRLPPSDLTDMNIGYGNVCNTYSHPLCSRLTNLSARDPLRQALSGWSSGWTEGAREQAAEPSTQRAPFFTTRRLGVAYVRVLGSG